MERPSPPPGPVSQSDPGVTAPPNDASGDEPVEPADGASVDRGDGAWSALLLGIALLLLLCVALTLAAATRAAG